MIFGIKVIWSDELIMFQIGKTQVTHSYWKINNFKSDFNFHSFCLSAQKSNVEFHFIVKKADVSIHLDPWRNTLMFWNKISLTI